MVHQEVIDLAYGDTTPEDLHEEDSANDRERTERDAEEEQQALVQETDYVEDIGPVVSYFE